MKSIWTLPFETLFRPGALVKTVKKKIKAAAPRPCRSRGRWWRNPWNKWVKWIWRFRRFRNHQKFRNSDVRFLFFHMCFPLILMKHHGFLYPRWFGMIQKIPGAEVAKRSQRTTRRVVIHLSLAVKISGDLAPELCWPCHAEICLMSLEVSWYQQMFSQALLDRSVASCRGSRVSNATEEAATAEEEVFKELVSFLLEVPTGSHW